MRMVIGFFLYWFSMNGYFMLFNARFKVKRELCFSLTTCLLIALLFIASILNILLLGCSFIYLGGLFAYLYLSKRGYLNKKYLVEYFDYKYLLLMVLVIAFTFLCGSMRITSYDNFSHWAVSIKQLFTYNSLASFKYNVDTFTSYPPGSALFIYYFSLIFKESEGAMLIGMSYLNLMFISSIMLLFNDKRKALSSFFFIIIVLVFSVINIGLNDLLVDTTLSLMGIATFIYVYTYQNDLRKCFYFLTILSVAFLLIKNSSIVFILLNGILLYVVALFNKDKRQGLKYLLYMFLIVIGFFLIWHNHLSMVYPDDIGYTSKHSISITNVGRNVLRKGPEKIKEIITIYLRRVFSIRNNIINVYLIVVNIFMLLLAFINKSYQKKYFKWLLLMDILMALYYLSLGLMYVISMPYEEALYLACFNRYMMTPFVTVMGLLIIAFYESIKEKNLKNYLLLGLFVVFLCCIFVNSNYSSLLGRDGYDDSEVRKLEETVEIINLDEYRDDKKLFYVKNDVSCTYYRFALRYLYFDGNIQVACRPENFDGYKEYDYVVLKDIDYMPFTDMNHNDFIKINDHLYKVQKEN